MQLPVAFRSLSRLSSALSAKASTLRSSSLNLVSQLPAGLLSFLTHSVVCQVISKKICLFITKLTFIILATSDVLTSIYRFKIFVLVFGFQGTIAKCVAFCFTRSFFITCVLQSFSALRCKTLCSLLTTFLHSHPKSLIS